MSESNEHGVSPKDRVVSQLNGFIESPNIIHAVQVSWGGRPREGWYGYGWSRGTLALYQHSLYSLHLLHWTTDPSYASSTISHVGLGQMDLSACKPRLPRTPLTPNPDT